MTIGERIKQRRKELGFSVGEIAEKLGKNRATVYRYESGDIEDLPTQVLENLAKALETTPAELMGWKVDVHKFYESAKVFNAGYRERVHLEVYRQLNDENKSKVDKLTETLLEVQNAENEILMAAHQRTDVETSSEDKKHDEDMMKDNF